MIDLGTGDGRYVLDQAKSCPETFVIGIDAVASAMSRASRMAERGHLTNALYLQASAEGLPDALAGTADCVTIHYPWGSLLKAVVLPDVATLAKIAKLLKEGGELHALINMQPFTDRTLASRLGLTDALLRRDVPRFCEACTRAGLRVDELQPASISEARATSWGRKLASGHREIWKLRASSTNV